MTVIPRVPKAAAAFVLATVIALATLLVLGFYETPTAQAHHKPGHQRGGTTPPPPPPPPTGTTATLIGAGDIASGNNQNDEATAKILDANPDATVFTAGDNAYDGGTISEFNNYYNPTWGRHKSRTKPSPGNHEYVGGTTPQHGAGYFSYFSNIPNDATGGSYSYNLGDWHIVSLNTGQCESNTSLGKCAMGQPMLNWLDADLAANSSRCTLAYFHHPKFSSGEHGNDFRAQAIWDVLYSRNADLVVSGHDHDYERFAPQNPSGAADATRGIREFVVGTGGASLRTFPTVRANSQARLQTHGVLKLNLKSDGYDAQFIGTDMAVKDSTSGTCH